MNKCINFSSFMQYLFEEEKQVKQSAEIIKAMLEVQSPRLTNISEQMAGKSASNYKRIQRFLESVDLKQRLLRFYQTEAEFVIGDPTEMKRYRAPQTSYVGTLSDGKTAGYWLMVLSTPYRGRSLPCWFVVYSSRTIGTESTSRNLEHCRCFEGVKQLLGERPLVLDREFSYEALMQALVYEKLQFVIRLNQGETRKKPRIVDADGQAIKLFVRPGQTVTHSNVYYLGTVKVNLVGFWMKGLSNPMWIITTLEPKRALEIYLQRMKIEETFRDCKDLLRLTRLMNKKQAMLEQMIALTLIAYVVGVWLGEAIRDVVYGQVSFSQLSESLLVGPQVDVNSHPKWLLYSGLFVLLKQKVRLSRREFDKLSRITANSFATLLFDDVRLSV